MSPQESSAELITYLEPPKQRFSRVRRLIGKVGDLIAVYTECAYLDDDFNRWDVYPNPYTPSSRLEDKAPRPRTSFDRN